MTVAADVAERAARESYGRLLAYLASRTGDVHAAEDALSEAFAAALVSWPQGGVPHSPEAWLLTAARRRLIDDARRRARFESAAAAAQAAFDAQADIPDERVALMFACAHPAVAENVRAPLVMQTILGLDAETIASAFLMAPAAMSQRLVRAKRKIAVAGIPLRIPEDEVLQPRLQAVLDAIYAAFATGSNDDARGDPEMRGLAQEAIWLARVVVKQFPREPEALGLLALMLHVDARGAARRDARGRFVPLDRQEIARWNMAAVDEAEARLRSASREGRIGRYQIEAAVQSVHAARRENGRTNWPAIVTLYDALLRLTGSVVVAINHAVARGEAESPQAGLAALDAIEDERLVSYQPYWAARAELLRRTGDAPAARAAYERAIGLASDPAVREFLQERMLLK